MKSARIILSAGILIGFCCGFACCTPHRNGGTDSLLTVLDETIANKALYTQARQNKIDSLKRELIREADTELKINIAGIIFNLYFDFQNDLAMEYVVIMRELAEELCSTNPDYLFLAEINHARLLRYTGLLKEATELLDNIGSHKLSPNVHYLYLAERMLNYTFLRDNSSIPAYKERYDMMAEVYRDSVFMFGDRTGVIIRVERLLKENKLQDALTMLHAEYDSLDPLSRRAGTMAYNIALCHQAMNDMENYKLYLIRSAIADLHGGVRGYKSLQQLAILMYKTGDIDRAYNYMKCSMEDAIQSSARIRAREASEMFVIIDESYQEKVSRQKQVVTNLLLVTGIVGILLLISVFIIGFQNSRLATAKLKLQEANLMKEGYLGVFIEEYSNYLSRMNSYRIKSAKILKKGDRDEINKFVDEALNTADDLKELYRKFDATILNIFPTFVSEFNMLMNGDNVDKEKRDSTELTAEQRIAAFIRLGIKETKNIALFLRYSMRTVYNYRSQMRSKAKNSKDFEKDIMRIGTTHIKRTSS